MNYADIPCKPSRCIVVTMLAVLLSVPSAFGQQPDVGTDAQREAGRLLYEQNCSQCHGDDGAGDGPGAMFFRPAPRNFTSATFKFRSTGSGDLPTTADIKRSIRDGMPYTGMPAWPSLSEAEVANLAYYIKTFSDDFTGPYGTPASITIPKPPLSTPESIARGREVFLENQCTDCHGNLGRGNGKSAPTLRDQWGDHIRPADMTKRWTFRNGSTKEDIYRTFSTGLDGSPMPSYDIDPPEDKWHLVNYVYSLSRDEPNYATLVVASPTADPIDLDNGAALFETSTTAYFPVVAQVIEEGRLFHSGVSGIDVNVVYNDEDVAIMLGWNDMTAETTGTNSPGKTTDANSSDSTAYSDAVAIQFPREMPTDSALPYFLYGNSKKPVDLWFVDMANGKVQQYSGKGAGSLQEQSGSVEARVSYDEGRWTAFFKRTRTVDGGIPFAEGSMIPFQLSVWDGFNGEHGTERGITSWYYVYTEPMSTESPAGPVMRYVLLTMLLGFGSVALVRQKQHVPFSFMPTQLSPELAKARVDVALDIIRSALGVALFIRGILWAADTELVVATISAGDNSIIGSAIFVHFVVFAHIVGGLMLMVGFRTRAAAAFQIPVLLGAVFIAFFRGSLFTQDQSFELAALVLVILIVLAMFGSGTYSLDHYIYRRGKVEGPTPMTNMGGIAYGLTAVGLLTAIGILGIRLLIEKMSGGEVAAIAGVTVVTSIAFLIFYGFGRRKIDSE